MNLFQIGRMQRLLGQPTEALAAFERSLLKARESGDRRVKAMVLGVIGELCLMDLNDLDRARSCLTRSVALFEEVGDPERQSIFGGQLGMVHLARGDPAAARLGLARAIRMAVRGRWQGSLATHLANLARVQLAEGSFDAALASARRGRTALESFLGGFAQTDGETDLTRHRKVMDAGMLAAAAAGDPRALLSFLELGRIEELQATLGAQRRVRLSIVPTELSTWEVANREQYERARREIDRALISGDPEDSEEKSLALRLAMDFVRGHDQWSHPSYWAGWTLYECGSTRCP